MSSKWWQGCRKIIAIGRNYKLHAEELGNKVPSKPFWFLKPSSSILLPGQGPILVPEGIDSIHHEVELGVVIGRKGKKIIAEEAMDFVSGYCLSFDMTARQWQNQAKDGGKPWTLSKCFDTALPISAQFFEKSQVNIPSDRSGSMRCEPFVEAQVPDPHALTIWCDVNGESRQRGSTADMVFDVPSLIAAVSLHHTLEENDLILTGTPAGVGPVMAGDKLKGGIDELNLSVEFDVQAAA